MIVNPFRLLFGMAAISAPILVLSPAHAVTYRDHDVTSTRAGAERVVLHFEITLRGFHAFKRIGLLRLSRRLEVLPGFPENTCLHCGVLELRRDPPSLRALARAHLTPRDYILTGWALVLARSPADWGLDERRLPAAARRNVAFVRAHLAEVDAVLNAN